MRNFIKAGIIAVTAAITLSACGGANYDTTHYNSNNISHCTQVVHFNGYWECHRYTSGWNYRTQNSYKPYKAPKKVSLSKPKTGTSSVFKKSTSTFRSSSRR